MTDDTTYHCHDCGTRSFTPAACSVCTRVMTRPERAALFCIAMSEGSASLTHPDYIVGPFHSVMEADQWWEENHLDERYADVTAMQVCPMRNPKAGARGANQPCTVDFIP